MIYQSPQNTLVDEVSLKNAKPHNKQANGKFLAKHIFLVW